MYLDWPSAIGAIPLLLEGAKLTILISVVSFVLAVPLGLVVAWLRRAPRPFRAVGTLYVEVLRNTPLLLQIFFLFYGLPSFGIHLPAEVVGIYGLTVNLSAYLAETFRSGIAGVPGGMKEAATALAFGRWQAFRYVVLPVAMRLVYPATANLFIMAVLASSLLSVIAIPELTGITNLISSQSYRTIETYSMSTIIYIGITAASALCLAFLGRRLFPKATRG